LQFGHAWGFALEAPRGDGESLSHRVVTATVRLTLLDDKFFCGCVRLRATRQGPIRKAHNPHAAKKEDLVMVMARQVTER
jgi:hypothetical protein